MVKLSNRSNVELVKFQNGQNRKMVKSGLVVFRDLALIRDLVCFVQKNEVVKSKVVKFETGQNWNWSNSRLVKPRAPRASERASEREASERASASARGARSERSERGPRTVWRFSENFLKNWSNWSVRHGFRCTGSVHVVCAIQIDGSVKTRGVRPETRIWSNWSNCSNWSNWSKWSNVRLVKFWNWSKCQSGQIPLAVVKST